VTAGKLNCSTRCSLVGTQRITLRGLLLDCSPVSKKGPVRKDGATSEHIVQKFKGQKRSQTFGSEVRRIPETEYRAAKTESLVMRLRLCNE
jgi:hypothetical protein